MDGITESDLRALFRLHVDDVRAHTRCGKRSSCYRQAVRDCDAVLDERLESVAVRDVPAAVAGAEPGAVVL